MRNPAKTGFVDRQMVVQSLRMAVGKLDPRQMVRNPVMFVVEVVALLATLLFVRDLVLGASDIAFTGQLVAWLWLTILFANFAEAFAEGRGQARADSLRGLSEEGKAKRLCGPASAEIETIPASELKTGDVVLVESGDMIPADGEVVEGIASVDESAITGESDPVIRETGGDRSAVTGGTTVVSDWLKVAVTQRPGESFLDRMIAMVEGAQRQKTPNELALTVLLVSMTIIFLVVVVTLQPFAAFAGTSIAATVLIALTVTLIPTTIGALLSAIGIAGMDRLVQANVIAKSGRAVETSGDVDTLLLDKTGTITFGNRMADAFIPLPGGDEAALAEAAGLASIADDTPEGKSIVALAKSAHGFNPAYAEVEQTIPFSAETRMSGADLKDGKVRKGASDAMRKHLSSGANDELDRIVDRVARDGGTPLVVARDNQVLGVVHLKDIIKPGIKERFASLRRMGIRTVMITGDNPLTAAAIAAEAGVDDFLAEATPERKLQFIRDEQAAGHMVAMIGDGSNDAPALAQADIGVAMQDGTQPAREASNMIDLDSDPTKLLQVVEVGKQLLISRGALTTFSIANDVAKYFAIIPAIFVAAYPALDVLDLMDLGSPQSAILSAVIFNALIIIALIPLALRGVTYSPASAPALLRRNLLIYGLGGLIVPFVGIKVIDLVITSLHLV